MEKKTKYTPGPWEAISYSIFQSDEVGTKQIVHNVKGGTPEECKANAHLIAAAPELLSICKDIQSCIIMTKSFGFKSIDWDDLLAGIDEIIAKAEGR